MTIAVGQLAPVGCWDVNCLTLLLTNRLYPTGLNFKLTEGYPNTEGCVLIVPSRYWAAHTDQINETIKRYEWLLFMRVGDEEDTLDIRDIVHPNARFWVQTPRTDREYGDARLFGVGFPPHFNELPAEPRDRPIDVFLAGQKTHDRREQAFQALHQIHDDIDVCMFETEGFTQGLEPKVYRGSMLAAKIAPCPSGAVSPDSFRFWEALEAHCVPIADDVSPKYLDEEAPYFSEGFWGSMFEGNLPFPVLTNYADLPGYIADVLAGWPANANRVAAWWARYKRDMTLWLETDLKALGAL